MTLAHAAHLADELEHHPEVEEQLGYATCVLLNHSDRLEAAGLDRVEALVRERNPTATRYRSVRARVPVAEVLGASAGIWRTELEGELHRHTEGAGAIVLRARAPLDLHRLKMWLGFLAEKRDAELWRLKGVLSCAGHERAVVVQGVYQWLELGPGEESAPPRSVLVVIGGAD